MSELIRSKVARVLNSREIAIAAGAEQGVRVGMYFDVLDPKGKIFAIPILEIYSDLLIGQRSELRSHKFRNGYRLLPHSR